MLKQADKKKYLSKEHFSVDGTLIQAWAGHKSFVRKDGKDDEDGSDFRGKSRSNATHESTTDPDSRLYRKGKTASELRFMGHTLMENRNGLIVNAMVTQADGYAEREAAKAMVADIRQNEPEAKITLGADKGYDAAEFIQALQAMNVIPHIAQNKSNRASAVPDEIAQTEGYAISQQKRKLIEQGFGWTKFIGPIRQVMVHGIKRVDQVFVLAMAALCRFVWNLTKEGFCEAAGFMLWPAICAHPAPALPAGEKGASRPLPSGLPAKSLCLTTIYERSGLRIRVKAKPFGWPSASLDMDSQSKVGLQTILTIPRQVPHETTKNRHGGLQPCAHAHLGKNPSTDSVKGEKVGERASKKKKKLRKAH